MIKLLKELGQSRKIQLLARQVAERSVEPVYQRISGHTTSMTTSEARGFIRARAAAVVRRQTRLLLSRHKDAQNSWTHQIVRHATERLIPLVLRQDRKSDSRLPVARTAA